MAKKQKQKDYSEFIVTAAEAIAEEQRAGVRLFLQVEADELPVVLAAIKRFHERRQQEEQSE